MPDPCPASPRKSTSQSDPGHDRDAWRHRAELARRVAFLAWLDCADGATRRQLASELVSSTTRANGG